MTNVPNDVSFWFRFLELQEIMLFTMKRIGIFGDPLESQPSHQAWKWPLNLNTQKFCPNPPRVTLVGNPLIYWLNLFFLICFLLVSLVKIFQSNRESPSSENQKPSSEDPSPPDRLLAGACRLFLAYILHYVPFFSMGRQLYIHHYLPAFYFSCLLSAVLAEYLLSAVQEGKSIFKESKKANCLLHAVEGPRLLLHCHTL